MAPRSPTARGALAIRQSNLREHNLGLVLRIIVDASTPPSRAVRTIWGYCFPSSMREL